MFTSAKIPTLVAEAYAHHLEFDQHDFDLKTDNTEDVVEFIRDNCGHTVSVPDLSGKEFTLLGCTRHEILNKERSWVKYKCGDEKLSLFMCSAGKFKLPKGTATEIRGVDVVSRLIKDCSVAAWEVEGITCVMACSVSEGKLLSIVDYVLSQEKNEPANALTLPPCTIKTIDINRRR